MWQVLPLSSCIDARVTQQHCLNGEKQRQNVLKEGKTALQRFQVLKSIMLNMMAGDWGRPGNCQLRHFGALCEGLAHQRCLWTFHDLFIADQQRLGLFFIYIDFVTITQVISIACILPIINLALSAPNSHTVVPVCCFGAGDKCGPLALCLKIISPLLVTGSIIRQGEAQLRLQTDMQRRF